MKGRNDTTEAIMLFAAIIIFGSLFVATCYCLYSFGKGHKIHTTEWYRKHEVTEVVSCEKVNNAEKDCIEYKITVNLDGKEYSIETFKEYEAGTMISVTLKYYYVDGELVTEECIGIDYF